MHAVIRRYRVRLGTMEQAARHAEKWFLPLVRKIPGFMSYYLVAAEDGVLAALGLFETAAGADAAVALATGRVRGGGGSVPPPPPPGVAGAGVARTLANSGTAARLRAAQSTRASITPPPSSSAARRGGGWGGRAGAGNRPGGGGGPEEGASLWWFGGGEARKGNITLVFFQTEGRGAYPERPC